MRKERRQFVKGKEGHDADHIYRTVQPPVLLTRDSEAQSGVSEEDWGWDLKSTRFREHCGINSRMKT